MYNDGLFKHNLKEKVMRLIGITGSSGSGKSTVADFYARCGYTVIDGDGVSRELAVPGSAYVAALVKAFGPDICDENGALDRRAMGAIAFSCPENQKKLTQVTTPLKRLQLTIRISAGMLRQSARTASSRTL